MSKRALDVLSKKLVQGAKPGSARRETIHEVSTEISSQLTHRSLEDALHSVGLERTLAARIRDVARSNTPKHVTDALQIVIGGGGVSGIPTAECLNRHLPPDREPTEEEVAAAIKACSKQDVAQGI